MRIGPQRTPLLVRKRPFMGTLATHCAEEPLRQHGFESAGHQAQLQAQVQQVGQSAGGVIGAKGREDQVAGERGMGGISAVS
jgi:hypothetical protein